MFSHMVMFRFGDRETAEEVVEKLHHLARTIDEVAELVVGVDELRSPRSFDVGMLMRFADRTAFERYNAHPAHVPVAEWIDGAATEAVAVDWSG